VRHNDTRHAKRTVVTTLTETDVEGTPSHQHGADGVGVEHFRGDGGVDRIPGLGEEPGVQTFTSISHRPVDTHVGSSDEPIE
jgi:hypothetical protein